MRHRRKRTSGAGSANFSDEVATATPASSARALQLGGAEASELSLSKKLEGAIDSVFPDGTISGWARSLRDPFAVIQVVVKCAGAPIAQGQAIQFRKDLFDKNVGHGWYGFRLRPIVGFEWTGASRLHLHNLDNDETIGPVFDIRPGASFQVLKIELQTIGIDGSFVEEIEHVRGFLPLIERFIRHHGHARFVDFAYCFVLGRPADPSGLEKYVGSLSQGEMNPFQVLEVLYRAEERGERRVPPPLPLFPFRE